MVAEQCSCEERETVEEETERENVGNESDVAEEMISAMVKLAKESVESGKLRIEDESVDEDAKNTDDNEGPDEVFDGGENTDERVKNVAQRDVREKRSRFRGGRT